VRTTGSSPLSDEPREARGKRSSQTVNPPIFILCTARSGSTLLRYLLDAHQHIYAPAETNFSSALQAIHFLAHSLYAKSIADTITAKEGRSLAKRTIERSMRANGARRWCDKSLSTLHHTNLVANTFTDAQYILLYRNFNDFALSAIEASHWGFDAYGLEPYVRHSPDNFLRALALYWSDMVSRQMAFERAHSSSTHRIRYEDLVRAPKPTLMGVWQFLNLPPARTDPEIALLTRHAPGPGDHKIDFTTRISDASVDKTTRIPLERLDPDLATRINALHADLEYRALAPNEGSTGPSAEDRTRGLGLKTVAERVLKNWPLGEFGTVQDIQLLQLGGRHGWNLNLPSGQASYRAWDGSTLSIQSNTATFEAVASGRTNFAAAVRDGSIHVTVPHGLEDSLVHETLRNFAASLRH